MKKSDFKNFVRKCIKETVDEYRTKGAVGLKFAPAASENVPVAKMVSDLRKVVSLSNLQKLQDLADLMGITNVRTDEDALFKAIQMKLDIVEKSSNPNDISKLKTIYDVSKERKWLKEDSTVPEKHQMKIAKDTLKMHDLGASIMGGMSKEEARDFLKKMGWTDARIKSFEDGQTMNEGKNSSSKFAFTSEEKSTIEKELLKELIEEEINDEVEELLIYIDNNRDLRNQQMTPIYQNLTRRKKKGTYDASLAPKLFRYLVDNGAKRYAKEFSTGVDNAKNLFPGKVRDEAAMRLTKEFEEAWENKDYDFMK